MQRLKRTVHVINLPLLFVVLLAPRRALIHDDLGRWERITSSKRLEILGYPEYRTLLLYRLHCVPLLWLLARIVCVFLRPERTLFIKTQRIGPGLYIQHGFATIIAASSIGCDCWINQQVTVGYDHTARAPAIGDNVRISAGAIAVGGIHIGNNVTIGAGAVVVKDVDSDTVVGGVPARPLRTGRPVG